MMTDATYWDDRYKSGEIQWDMGHVSPPLAKYFEQLKNRDLKILIPGCGNAYEGEYLWHLGFDHVYLMDFSESTKQNFLKRVPDFPEEQFLLGNFFEHQGEYDLIVEQTFFCAITKDLRPAYAQKMHQLLKPGGKLVGLLFNVPLNEEHPPYGGSSLEYLGYFSPYFKDIYLQACVNSIEPRLGRELFMKLVK